MPLKGPQIVASNGKADAPMGLSPHYRPRMPLKRRGDEIGP
jgi:hypothetical protein